MLLHKLSPKFFCIMVTGEPPFPPRLQPPPPAAAGPPAPPVLAPSGTRFRRRTRCRSSSRPARPRWAPGARPAPTQRLPVTAPENARRPTELGALFFSVGRVRPHSNLKGSNTLPHHSLRTQFSSLQDMKQLENKQNHKCCISVQKYKQESKQ